MTNKERYETAIAWLAFHLSNPNASDDDIRAELKVIREYYDSLSGNV